MSLWLPRCGGAFRDLTVAASLKPGDSPILHLHVEYFPRLNSRGLIEANTLRSITSPKTSFRDLTVAASLKRIGIDAGEHDRAAFPRLNSRGLIEARIR